MKHARTLPATIDLTRTSTSQGVDYITLRITDTTSRVILAECRIELADFARAVTAHGGIPMTMTVPTPDGLARIGQVRENQKRLLQLAQADAPRDPEAWRTYVAESWLDQYPEDPADGWELFGVDDRPNHHLWTPNGGYQVQVQRWTDPT